MSVRDLGYRAYEGELHSPSRNTWVMVRYGLWRIWGSWINRIALFLFWVPLLLICLLALVRLATPAGWGAATIPETAGTVERWILSPPSVWLRLLTGVQFWFFVTIVTLRSGAGVISDDLNNRAYQFYFAKPVTPIQYLVGHIGALAIWIFGLVFVPTMLLTLLLIGLSPEELRLERLGLLLPAFFDGVIIAIVTASLSVASSALSRSRALTLASWALILIVPFILALIVEWIGGAEWAHVIAAPGLLWSVGDGLYKVELSWDQLHWYYSAACLVLVTSAAVYGALSRIERAEVIT